MLRLFSMRFPFVTSLFPAAAQNKNKINEGEITFGSFKIERWNEMNCGRRQQRREEWRETASERAKEEREK